MTRFSRGCHEEAVLPLLGQHDPRGTQHQGPDGSHLPCCNYRSPVTEVQQRKKSKQTRDTTSSTCVRHKVEQETPIPTYFGMMMNAHTCKKELVDRLPTLDLSISYDRVLQLSAQIRSNVCKPFHRDQFVCPRKMRGEVFTTAAIDNIDHNPSATPSKGSFCGTAISLIQHPSYSGEGINRSSVFT